MASATRCCNMMNSAARRQLVYPLRKQPSSTRLLISPTTGAARSLIHVPSSASTNCMVDNNLLNQQQQQLIMVSPLSTYTKSVTPSTASFLCSSSASPEVVLGRLYEGCRYFSSTDSSSTEDKSKSEPTAADDAAAASSSAGEEGEATESESTGEEEVDPTTKKINDLEAEVTELKNQLLRSLADQENTRRIAQQDMENARQLATKGFAKSLLEVWDNLSRALDAAKEHGSDEDTSIVEGIEMTQNILRKSFESNGLKQIKGDSGDPFDPQVHHALSQYKDPSKTPGTIGQVVKSGFMLHKHVLRPADVMVIAKED